MIPSSFSGHIRDLTWVLLCHPLPWLLCNLGSEGGDSGSYSGFAFLFFFVFARKLANWTENKTPRSVNLPRRRVGRSSGATSCQTVSLALGYAWHFLTSLQNDLVLSVASWNEMPILHLLLLLFIWIIAVSEGFESDFYFILFLLLMTMELLEVWMFYCLLKRQCDAVRLSLTFLFGLYWSSQLTTKLGPFPFMGKKTEANLNKVKLLVLAERCICLFLCSRVNKAAVITGNHVVNTGFSLKTFSV